MKLFSLNDNNTTQVENSLFRIPGSARTQVINSSS